MVSSLSQGQGRHARSDLSGGEADWNVPAREGVTARDGATARVGIRGSDVDMEQAMEAMLSYDADHQSIAAVWSRLARRQRWTSRDPKRSLENGHLSVWQQLSPLTRRMIFERTIQKATCFGARQAANVLWAAAELGSLQDVFSEDDSQKIGMEGGKEGDSWICHNFSEALVAASSRTLPQCNPQELACSIYALAKLRWTEPGLEWQHSFYSSCQRQWSDFSRQELSMVLWALANLGWVSHGDPKGISPPEFWLRDLLLAQASALQSCGCHNLKDDGHR